MKVLVIKYGNITLFNGSVAEVSWTDNEDGVTVTGKTKKASGGNIFEMLSAAAKKQTEEEVEEKKAELAEEKKAAVKKRAAVEEPVEVIDADE